MASLTNGVKSKHTQMSEFRKHLPDLSSPRFTAAAKQDAHSYSEVFQREHNPPWLYNLTQAWKELYQEPYKGVTNDGTIRQGLFPQQDEGVPIQDIVRSVKHLLGKLTVDQQSSVSYPVNAKEWRAWSNPEFLLRPFGLRLDEVEEFVATSILDVIKASFSEKGYQKALAAMRINGFLGDICHMSKVMNKYSYNFLLFGTPSTENAWGWLLYGHHLCLSVFFKGTQIVVSPFFTGAEPNEIDEGEFKGTAILHTEGDIGLRLMQSLPAATQKKAQTYKLLKDPAMPQTGDLKTDRWNQDDQRHLCGAFRDNRVVPYEGVLVSEMTADQQSLVLDIVEQYLLYLPDTARKMKKEQIQKFFHETYFSWIGAYGDNDAFYYRIQSPVIIIEFDHHSGVFLSNKEPAKFHTHTILRTPNAGDYGVALRSATEQI